MARGSSAREAALELGVTVETARVHLRNAYRKLGVGSRAELARLLG